MTVKLHRSIQNEHGTFGVLSMEGKPLCVTLELPWKQNKPKVSCIPEGIYHCVPHSGQRFSNVWRLLDVPGRDSILIHAGNTVDDIQGCILVGMSFGEIKGKPAVLQSQDALDMLRRKLPKEFTLQVIDP